MEHVFFLKAEKEQRLFLLKISAVLLLSILIVLSLAWLFNFYLLVVIIPVLISIAAPFIDVPTGVKSGQFTHYSSLFIASSERKGEVAVHGGTLFDYYFNLASVKPAERKKVVLLSYLKGLMRLVEKYEEDGREELVIKGTSYVINERTAEKVGFKPVRTDFLQKMILALNYIPVIIAYSYTQGKVGVPDLSKVITLKATIKELADHKEAITRLVQRMEG
ncbi:hypothetical protein JMN32_20455 [Fulvivirga sp. 29W222]|uniref:Uncharacterized protein n=1 Tax=Fulvivirga marina TaxID=2494733 RepID=A0A937KD19_9BACT|nr:hypothetical protein [Fulvivirga marina]MBL6448696.1 hypothetical protein [Fulvivirga marina]